MTAPAAALRRPAAVAALLLALLLAAAPPSGGFAPPAAPRALPRGGAPPLQALSTEEDRASSPPASATPVRPKSAESHRSHQPHRDEGDDVLDYHETRLQKRWDEEWADVDKREGLDWFFEKQRRAMVGRSKYPKTVDEMGGLPLFGKDGIPERMGGISFWTRAFVRPPAKSRYSDAGVPGSKTGALDAFRILFNNLLQFLIGNESEDLAPVASWDPRESFEREGPLKFLYYLATGNLQELAGGPLFLLLNIYYRELGPIFKLAFGPRSFIVVSDPVMAKHILTKQSPYYDKGMLAEILEPIMGKGLIPADPDTWRDRRRVIVPGFHRRWLDRQISLFARCNSGLIRSLYEAADAPGSASSPEGTGRKGAPGFVDMEEKFCSVTLDIIGNAVFNYDFDSSRTESPVVKAVYRCLREAEHRSTAFIPYWQIPGLSGEGSPLEGQRKFAQDLKLLNAKLDECIERAFETRDEADVEELEERTYASDDDASLLRFLVDMKGEGVSDKQLRDDLMTMLVAGHETTAALLTWTLFEMCKARDDGGKDYLDRCRAEIDSVLGDRMVPTYDDILKLDYTRLCLIEGLRLYPEPPVLIRRSLDDDQLPVGGGGSALDDLDEGTLRRLRAEGLEDTPFHVARGADVFVSTWNLHRSEELWDEPLRYNPDRWSVPYENDDVEGWRGFRPERISGLYPDEMATDFAFLPFGAGARKCVGDQFAMLEAAVTFSLIVRRFDFEFGEDGSDAVGLRTGATIHTENGLWMRVRAREGVERSGSVWVEPDHPVLNPGGEALRRQQQEEKKRREAKVKEPSVPGRI